MMAKKDKGRAASKFHLDAYAVTAVGFTLAGLALRLYQLGAENITCDEGYSIRLAGLGVDRILRTLFASDFNPPLHFLLLRYWIGIFGNSEFSARLPSAIFGAASVFAIYKLGKLVFSERAGIIGALLLSLSWFQVYYSQEARAYSLMVLLSILSFYYFVALLKARNRKVTALYVISSALLLYSHLFAIFIVAAQSVYILYLSLARRADTGKAFRRWAIRGWTAHQLALLALFSPWLFVLSNQVFRAKELVDASNWVIEKPTSASALQPFVSFAGSIWLLILYCSILAIASLLALQKEKRSPFRRPPKAKAHNMNPGKATGSPSKPHSDVGKTALLLSWLLVPTLCAFVLSYTSVPVYVDKYLIGTSPALYLLVARALDRLWAKYRIAAAAAIAAVVALSGYGLWDTYVTINKKQSKEVAAVIDENASAGDLVIVNPKNYVENVFDYYSKRADLVEVGFPSKGFYANEENVKVLPLIAKKFDRIWLVEFLDDEKGLKLIEDALSRTHELAGDGRYAGVSLLYYEKKGR